MRVLYVEHKRGGGGCPGGAEVQLRKTAESLARLGITVDIEPVDTDVDLHQYDIIHYFNIYYADKLIELVQRAECAGTPAVISTILWDLTPFYYSRSRYIRYLGTVLGPRAGLALYRLLYNVKFRRSVLWKVQKKVIEKAAAILPNSNAEMRYLMEYFCLRPRDAEKMEKVVNGIDARLYMECESAGAEYKTMPSHRPVVAQVGTIEPVKNQAGLIRALYDTDVSLLFVGAFKDDDYVKQCRRLGDERGRTKFIQRQSQRELYMTLRGIDIHALPSWRETPGLASLEAAAAGCSIVTTGLGCAREYFHDMAFYCDPRSSTSIRTAVLDALNSPKPLGLSELVKEQYTWDRAARQTLAVYERILDKRALKACKSE
ncbi:MAG: glycosyltransferase [Verrucomicrobiae bacterium]|nr:glycosyltransferase [Verrucomicrobiae bacterium]